MLKFIFTSISELTSGSFLLKPIFEWIREQMGYLYIGIYHWLF